MACPKIALTMLILGSVMVLGSDARAQAGAPGPARLAQAPTSPAPPATPPSPPAASQPAAPTAQQTPDPVGSVATLQGGASVTRNNATSALALRDPVYKTDVLQTNVDGTLGITFDDETTFTLKPNTRLAVDEFVYEAGGTNNAAIFNVVRGTAAFVAAEVAHTGNMQHRYAVVDAGHSRHHRSGRGARGRCGWRSSLHQALSRCRRPGRPDRSFRPRRRAARHPVARRHRLCDSARSGRPLQRGAVADFPGGSRARPHLRAPDVRGAHRRPPDQSAAPDVPAAAQSAAA